MVAESPVSAKPLSPPMPASATMLVPGSLADSIQKIVATYRKCGGPNHLGLQPLPSYQTIEEILEDFWEILFPGYGRRQPLPMDSAAFYIGDLMHQLHGQLSDQIARAFRHDCREQRSLEDYLQDSKQLANEILQSLPNLRETLADDVQAAYDGDPAAKSLDEIIFCYPGLRAVAIFRIAHIIHKLGVPLIPRMMTEQAHSKTGIDIHPGATIGRRFFIDHGTGVVIGETTEIGNNVKLYQGVTLGALSFPRDEVTGELRRNTKRHPTIEDDVVIYANATILGGNTRIGHHAIIGSSAWITQSIDPYTTVTMESPKLKFRGGNGNGNGNGHHQNSSS